MGTYLLVVSDDHAPILHGYGHTGLQRFWGHEFDFLGSRDVIGLVIIGLGICGFLLVVHWNHQCSICMRTTSPLELVWGVGFDPQKGSRSNWTKRWVQKNFLSASLADSQR